MMIYVRDTNKFKFCEGGEGVKGGAEKKGEELKDNIGLYINHEFVKNTNMSI
jgi:hypothetical protein